MKKDNITIKDIAEACGVGLGTVSRAINGKPGVREEVRAKILGYIHDIGWRSNNIAGKLNSARKGELVVFITSNLGLFDRFSDNDIMGLLVDRCIRDGFETMILTGNRKEMLEQCLVIAPYAVIQIGTLDGLGEDETKLRQCNVRLIQIAERENFTGIQLHPNHFDAGRQLVRPLLKAGHRQIGLVCGLGEHIKITSIEEAPTIRLRRLISGIMAEHPALNLAQDAISDNFGNPARLLKALKEGNRSAWICDEQRSCLLLLRCAYELKLRIPDDLSVVTLAPEKAGLIFPLNMDYIHPDNESRAQKVMALLAAPDFPDSRDFMFQMKYHKGESVAVNQLKKEE